MANNDATIIVGKLSDEELQKSIDKLVGEIATANYLIRKDFDHTINHIQKSFKSLGDIKVGAGGASDGGSSRRSSVLKQEEQAVKNLTYSYDNFAKTQQVAVRTQSSNYRNADTLETMKIQLELLRQRLIETRQQYSSFVALAANATRTGDKGLYQFATSNVHAFEAEAKSLIQQIRGVQNAVQQMGDVIQPQGHTIQNFANSIGKTNPELALLTQMLKSGKIEFAEFATAETEAATKTSKITEEIKKQAQAIRESEEWKKKGSYFMMLDKETNTFTTVEAKDRRSIEEQLLAIYEMESRTKKDMVQTEQQQNAQAKEEVSTEERLNQLEKERLGIAEKITAESKKRTEPKTFASYDTLREAMAHVLRLQQSQIRLANTETASYDKLNVTLKQLRQTYERLSATERKSEQGKVLIASMHEIEDAIRRVRQQASRPVNLQSALGLSERTIDDIAYKMQRLASYRSGLDVNVRRAEIREVNTEYDRLKRKMDEVMQKNQQMVASNNALGRSWNYMKNRLAFYFTVGASTQFIKNLIEIRSQYEMNERALGILIGSAERGTEIFQQLSQMALVSPYTLIELSSAAKQLTAYDIAAKDVVDTTRRLADMASAVGVPMERLTYALGQIKAYGYLNSRDARMFANAGIPLVKQLSEYYTQLEGKMVSVGDVYDRMKKKAIDFNSVMAVVTKMTDEGGKFFDFQAKMADTLKVRLANLTLAWNNMLNEMGAETQGVLTSMIGGLRSLFAHWKEIKQILETIAWTFGMAKLIQVIQIANIGFAAFGKRIAWNILVGRRLSSVIFSLAGSIKSLVTSPLTWWTALAMAATSATMAVWNMNEAQKALNKTLREGAKERYDNLEKFFDNYESIRKSLYKTVTDEKTGETKTDTVDIDKGEAKKAWEAIREQIELSSHASDEYIGKLLEVENISERVRQGFEILDEIKEVAAALKELGDDAIKLDTDWSDWWNANLLPDGWVDNLKDYQKELNHVREKYENVAEARAKWEENKKADAILNEDFVSLDNALVRFRNNIATTAQSVYDFLKLKGWDKDESKINEVFKQIQDKLIQEGNLDPQQGFILQTQWEEARSQAAKIVLNGRIEDEKAALRAAADEESKNAIKVRLETLEAQYEDFEKYNGMSRAYWNDFTKWLKEQHISETTEMFRGMDAEQIKSLSFQEGKYGEWIDRMVHKYAEEHKMSYDDAFGYLKHWVTNANTWSVFIPLTISTKDDKTIYQKLTEADTAIDTAYKKIQRLKQRQKELEDKGGAMSKDKEVAEQYNKVLEEIADAQEDYNKALADGGHSKKEDAAANKARKEAESELQKALKDELSLIDEVRNSYKRLTSAGVSHIDAINASTQGFDETVNEINKSLTRFGLKKLDLSKFAGITNPQELVQLLQEQLDKLMSSPYVKAAEIKELQVKIQKLGIDVAEFNQKTIADSLNNSLNRLKEDYELAVALDADPELGNAFAEMMGIDTESLPHTVKEYADEYTKYLNEYLGGSGSGIELPHLNLTNDDMKMFEEMVKNNLLNAEVYEKIAAAVKDVREKTNKDISETIKGWDKLIEKYGEYEAKVNAIRNNAAQDRVNLVNKAGNEDQKSKAVRLLTKLQTTDDPQKKKELEDELKALVTEVAQKDSSLLKIAVAIDNNQLNATATEAFNTFKESGIWEVATGNLSGMTNNALDGLIKSIENFKKSNKGLDSKKIKEIDRVIKSLRKQQREGNPFLAIGNAMDEAKERAAALKPELDKVTGQIKELEDKQKAGVKLSDEEEKQLKTLKDRWKELSDAGNLSATEIVGFINQCIGAASQAIAMFNDMVSALSGNKWNEAQEILGDVASTIEKAGQGAAIGAQVGGGWGALIGGVAGGVMGAITAFVDNGNKKITASMKESETMVKRLENAYKNLQYAIDEAYGAAKYGAEEAAIANKKLQLVELNRQLELAKSRTGKYRDEDEIESLKGQVIDLEQEINKAANDIVNDMLDISSVGSAAEELVSTMMEAFRNGEDYMKSFGDKFSDMIDNMIMKAIVSKVIGQRMEHMFAEIDEMAKSRASGANANIDSISTQMMKNEDRLAELEASRKYMETSGMIFNPEGYLQWMREIEEINQDNVKLKKELQEAQERYADAISITPEDADNIRERVDGWKDNVKSEFENWMEAFGLSFGDKKDAAQLSALQQGISGITETTAGAIEAYMNGVSQQVYLQSDLLMQIRDAVVGFSMDVQLGAMSQILLQLQMNYQIVESIHSMMSGWNNPAGNAMRVELI